MYSTIGTGSVSLAFCGKYPYKGRYTYPLYGSSVQEGALRIIYFLILHTMYILGYTCQGAATRGAQSTLTNDPKQRPMVSIVSGILTLLAVIGVWQKDRPEVLQHHSKIRKSAQNAPA